MLPKSLLPRALHPCRSSIHRLLSTSPLVKSLPAKAYTDPKYYDIDKKHVLGPSWQLLTHESLLLQDSDKGPATFVSDVVSGFPAIVVRSSKTGDLNAYHNICRHKAGPLEWSDTRGVCPLNGLKCKVGGWLIYWDVLFPVTSYSHITFAPLIHLVVSRLDIFARWKTKRSSWIWSHR
jgi:hypothetical protein